MPVSELSRDVLLEQLAAEFVERRAVFAAATNAGDLIAAEFEFALSRGALQTVFKPIGKSVRTMMRERAAGRKAGRQIGSSSTC